MHRVSRRIVCSLIVLFSVTTADAQTDTYRNDEYKFAMKIPPGYAQSGMGMTGANVDSSEVMFFNKDTREKIIVALNRNTDEKMKKMYWGMFEDPRSSNIILMKKEREGRVISKRKIDKGAFEGFASVSENMTSRAFLLQEVKIFPKSGAGSAIVSFLYRAQNHPNILKIIEGIEYNW